MKKNYSTTTGESVSDPNVNVTHEDLIRNNKPEVSTVHTDNEISNDDVEVTDEEILRILRYGQKHHPVKIDEALRNLQEESDGLDKLKQEMIDMAKWRKYPSFRRKVYERLGVVTDEEFRVLIDQETPKPSWRQQFFGRNRDGRVTIGFILFAISLVMIMAIGLWALILPKGFKKNIYIPIKYKILEILGL